MGKRKGVSSTLSFEKSRKKQYKETKTTFTTDEKGNKVVYTEEQLTDEVCKVTQSSKLFMKWSTNCHEERSVCDKRVSNLTRIKNAFIEGYKKFSTQQQSLYNQIEQLTEDDEKSLITPSDYDEYDRIKHSRHKRKSMIENLMREANLIPSLKDEYLLNKGVQSLQQFTDKCDEKIDSIREMYTESIRPIDFSNTDTSMWTFQNVVDCYLCVKGKMDVSVRMDFPGEPGGFMYFIVPGQDVVQRLYIDMMEVDIFSMSDYKDTILFEKSTSTVTKLEIMYDVQRERSLRINFEE